MPHLHILIQHMNPVKIKYWFSFTGLFFYCRWCFSSLTKNPTYCWPMPHTSFQILVCGLLSYKTTSIICIWSRRTVWLVSQKSSECKVDAVNKMKRQCMKGTCATNIKYFIKLQDLRQVFIQQCRYLDYSLCFNDIISLISIVKHI